MILLVDGISSTLDQQLVRRVDNLRILVLIVKLIEKEPHRVDPSAFLVVALDRGPPRILGVSGKQHRFLSSGVVVPTVQRFEVQRRQFPAPYRVDLADREPGSLLLLADRKPQLGE